MAIQLQGNGGTVIEVDGTTFRALRTTPRPMDHGALGHYRVAQTISLVAAQTTTGSLFTVRWTASTQLVVLTKIRLEFLQTGNHTANLNTKAQVFAARAFTTADSGGTAITLTGNNAKKRTSMGTSLMGDMRFASTSAGLTVGTRTLDSNPIFEMPIYIITTATVATVMPTFRKDLDIDVSDGTHPYVFASSEGLVVKMSNNFGAAGTADLGIDLSWAEVTAY